MGGIFCACRVRVLSGNVVTRQPKLCKLRKSIRRILLDLLVRFDTAWLVKFGYEPEGREFESLRAHHSYRTVAAEIPIAELGAFFATGNCDATLGMGRQMPAGSAANVRN
jgi:hypothetical protein